ncbi:beta-lactamase/transpeptidase-like protein [Leptodontidium sp. 2 PMI_412]|nr:beta-lactamase/transpeptidase-like protein [Leptodontidium sp. 2 PMI_412]
MEAFERELLAATAKKRLPGTVVAAANREGTFTYIRPFGNTSLLPDAPLVTEASTFCLASATKLVTSVAAVQHLLTHTSGISGFENEAIMVYYSAIGDSRGTLLKRYFTSQDPAVKEEALEELRVVDEKFAVEPLLFEPGTGWVYGQSTDWAGKLVEQLTSQALESHCQHQIFTPLSMKSTTFHPLSPAHPHIGANLLSMTTRTASGKLITTPSLYPLAPAHDMGGSNLYSSAPDFLSLLTSLLRNDGCVLKRETVDLMLGVS